MDYNDDLMGMFEVKGDPTIEEKGGVDPFPDGEVQVVKILKWIKQDDRQLPIFAVMGDQIKAMFVLDITDAEKTRTNRQEGPAMSATRSQLVALVRAFGGDTSKLPEGETSAFLLAVMAAVENNTKPRKAKVYKGWVQWVEGANPPSDYYLWEYVGARSLDRTEPIRFIKKTRQGRKGTYEADTLILTFRIVADYLGGATPYAGYTLDVQMYNPFEGVSSDGLRPATKIGKSGGNPADVERFLAFVKVFCTSDAMRHVWQGNPEKSKFGVDELEMPFVVINDYAKKAARRVIGKLDFSDGGAPKVDLKDFRPAQATMQNVQTEALPSTQTTALYDLWQLIEEVITPDVDVFKPTPKDSGDIVLDLTAEGRKWAKENLVPAWDSLELPVDNGVRFIGKLNDDQLRDLAEYLKVANGLNLPSESAVEEDEDEGF